MSKNNKLEKKVFEDKTEWYLNGKLHREDGPAIEYTNGDKFWYLNGKVYSEEEYTHLVKMLVFI